MFDYGSETLGKWGELPSKGEVFIPPALPVKTAGFFVGLDLGQAADYTAISVIEKLEAPTGEESKTRNVYHLRHIERPSLGTPYPAIVARVKGLMESEPLKGDSHLVVDATGVGAPVVDLLREADLDPVSITITGGDTVTQEGYRAYRVPKRDIVSTLQVLFQSGRLKIAEGLPEARVLVEELLSFKVKINIKTAHDSYEAWREGVHDDLVLSVALACWYGEKYVPARLWGGVRAYVIG